ncbi:MAG: sel1 repeat family protein [Gammaproteobacteria bacterium]|nr:MAG: sel1 repeat family protein [Gammaproteobacteria bacterium]
MSIKKPMLIIGLCILFTGCATTSRAPADNIQGPTESSTDVGMRYLAGQGVPQDDAKAFYYLSKGAAEDDPFAENELGYMYAAGKGTPRDDEKALNYYQQAADHGLASAQYNLGLMYLHGRGTPPNKALAMQWFQKAAAHGFEPAKVALAQNHI